MKKTLLMAALVALTLPALSQNLKKQFQYAGELYEDHAYDSALAVFSKIYHSWRVNETMAAKAYYNMGYILLEKKKYTEARIIFENILRSDYNEQDAGGIGSGLMAEPYALYKNRSCKILAELALDDKRFGDALEYTQLADTQYPYVHFCGNEYAANDIYMAMLYGRSYEGMGEPQKAIEKLIPQCTDNGLAENDEAMAMAIRLIRKQYSQETIKAAVDAASAGIRLDKLQGRYNTYKDYHTKLFNAKFGLNGYSFYASDVETETQKLTEKERCRLEFLNSKFIKTLLGN